MPPDYNDDHEAYWAWKSDYEENKKKYIEEEFVHSGPVRLLEAVYCDPCKAKVINSASKLKREEGFYICSNGRRGSRGIILTLFGAYWNIRSLNNQTNEANGKKYFTLSA